MQTINKIKVGSALIEGGVVYKVIKIMKDGSQNNSDRIIYYKPFYKNVSNSTLECSIPESSLKLSNFRDPSSKEEILALFSNLKLNRHDESDLDIENAAEMLKLNDIRQIAFVIKSFWKDSLNDGLGFTKTKSDLLKKAVSTIVEEIAYVMELSLDEAKNRISKTISKSSKGLSPNLFKAVFLKKES